MVLRHNCVRSPQRSNSIETSPVHHVFIVLLEGGDVIVIRQKTLRESLGINVMAQPIASVLNACRRLDGAAVGLPALVPCCGR